MANNWFKPLTSLARDCVPQPLNQTLDTQGLMHEPPKNGIQINNTKVKWVAPILEQWIRIHKEYVEQYKFKDCLYWYNERANVSAFAGAVWKAGASPLKSTQVKKALKRIERMAVSIYTFQIKMTKLLLKQKWSGCILGSAQS